MFGVTVNANNMYETQSDREVLEVSEVQCEVQSSLFTNNFIIPILATPKWEYLQLHSHQGLWLFASYC
jgi:hypothetical protein